MPEFEPPPLLALQGLNVMLWVMELARTRPCCALLLSAARCNHRRMPARGMSGLRVTEGSSTATAGFGLPSLYGADPVPRCQLPAAPLCSQLLAVKIEFLINPGLGSCLINHATLEKCHHCSPHPSTSSLIPPGTRGRQTLVKQTFLLC